MTDLKHEDVRRHFQEWQEDRLDRESRTRIDLHLEKCAECRTYFESLFSLLEAADVSRLPRLEPDPFLPTRIRAIVDGMGNEKQAARGLVTGLRRRFLGWAAITSISAVIAVTIGIFIGKDLASPHISDTNSSIAEAFYDAMAPGSVFADPGEVLANDDGDLQ